MEYINCDLCGGGRLRVLYRQPDQLFFHERWFNIVECEDCGLGFVNPRPTRQEIGEYYPASFFSSFEDPSNARRYSIEASYLPKLLAGMTGKLLDIGCANGGFPRHMRRMGWEVEGVETSVNAKEIGDFKVYRTDFPSIEVDIPTYDAVTAWAVLEHVHDPAAYFDKAARVLKPGGRFIFLVTNFESLSSRALFREDIPRHLYFFTSQSIGRYLDKSGLKLLAIRYDRKIFEMVPSNILYYFFCRHVLGRSLLWTDLPESLHAYVERSNPGRSGGLLGRVWSTNLRYAMGHPAVVIDRGAAKLFEQWQLYAKTYGIMICAAQKTFDRSAGRTKG